MRNAILPLVALAVTVPAGAQETDVIHFTNGDRADGPLFFDLSKLQNQPRDSRDLGHYDYTSLLGRHDSGHTKLGTTWTPPDEL